MKKSSQLKLFFSKIPINIAVLLCISLLFSHCKPEEKTQSGKLKIVTTTGIIGDAVKNITGDLAEVQSLMGSGVDPHLYKAAQSDLSKLREADVIFYNGLHLEGKMSDILHKLSQKKPVYAVSDGIPIERLRKISGTDTYDPHIWFDVSLWSRVVEFTGKAVAKHDSINADRYRQNTAAYLKKLDILHAKTKAEISEIPKNQRIMITAHDAFGYFGRAYDIEVKGLLGISTLSEYGLKDIQDLTKLIIERKIKAVFTETSVSKKALEAVIKGCESKGHRVIIGGNLYSDALGEKGTPEETYLGVVNANVTAVVNALK